MTVSWQLAAFLILGAALLAGFAWYERSRPPAQVVALVAALAALAIAGRLAFAAFPSVKPTTDLAVFSGYALGGAPGFAVGALTALASNLWFGQGPWTPWQMAGWGIAGLMGAGLASLTGRDAGRLTLAAVCGLAGIAYGALLNFSLMATYGGDLSLEHYLVLESRAAPFDAAHVAGNVVLALVAGPAMIRMLSRFRTRFEWRSPAVAGALLLVLALATTVPATARAASTSQAASWLVSKQGSDGGFGDSAGGASSPSTTTWAMLGLEAAGRNPLDVQRGGSTAVDYLRANVKKLAGSRELARAILALEGAGVGPRSFGGRNLVSALLKHRGAGGSYEGSPASTALAIVALRSAGATGSLDASYSWLGGAQNSDGGWGRAPGESSDTDATGAAMQAMPGSKAARSGLTYLRNHQHGNGGFASGGTVNSESTSWAVQGMIAVGTDPKTVEKNGKSGPRYLTGQQQGDGHFRYSSSDDRNPVRVTGQALLAAAGEALPVPEAPREPKPEPRTVPAPASTPQPSLPPVPIPGVSTTPTTPAPSGSVGSGSGSGGSSHAGPLIPGTATPPVGGSGAITPPVSPSERPEDLIEAAPVSAVEPDPDDPASPWIPIGIGLGVGLLALIAPVALGRRYSW